jgi:hypothetical protein
MTTTGQTTVTLRCTSTSGSEIAALTLTATSFAATALRAVVGEHTTGSMPAERFARAAFMAVAGYERRTDLRSRVIAKRLRELDRLALAAVGRGIPATITWA